MSTHLHAISAYSLLQSTIRPQSLVEKAKEYGYTHVALTDRNVMHGVPSFLAACRQAQIHPIIGLEATCLYHGETVAFLLLAMDNQGYANLVKLSSLLCETGHPCAFEDMKKLGAHCHWIAYGEGGWFASELIKQDYEGVADKLRAMQEELPHFDVALSYQETSFYRERNATLKRLCQSLSIPTVALSKIWYLEQQDAQVHRILNGIATSRTLMDSSLSKIEGRYFLKPQEMERLYDADDLARSDEIARQCRCDYALEKTSLPEYVVANGMSAHDYLPLLCEAGLRKRFDNHPSEIYERRLAYELDIIRKTGFEDYFLIVYDFIRYARSKGINVGPGRGSAAGSLAAYCLGITMVDPVKYNLLFERFLNPERVSMPDIDTDIPDDKREEVIHYVAETYGKDHVAGIVTFGTFGAKQALRDVARVMNVGQREVDQLAKLVPNIPRVTLADTYAQNKRFKVLVDSDRKLGEVYWMARRIEGLPRHASTHAAGVVLSRKPLQEIVPVMKGSDTLLNTQYTMEHLEALGLIKMDFLGLKNLTIINEIVNEVKKTDPSFRLYGIPLDHPGPYSLFAMADTAGVFQFESEGMRNLLRKMRPSRFEDIVASLALFRPASADSIPRYLENRRNPLAIRYPSQALAPVLKETYGVMIYQEQAMMTARIAAGFSLGKADILRKAMSKKNEKQIEGLRSDFMRGAEKNGYDPRLSQELYNLVAQFGGYGFNKSHAVAYGLVSYQMAYLKAVYPLHFHVALLNHAVGDSTKTAEYVEQCRRKKIPLISPSINESMDVYVVHRSSILIPLSVVRSIGVGGARLIMEERNENGLYLDLFDFVARMQLRKMTRASIEALIDAGALDCLGYTRRSYLSKLDEAFLYADLVRIGSGAQISIDLGLVTKPQIENLPENELEKSDRERNALGYTLGLQAITIVRQRLGIDEPLLSSLQGQIGRVHGFAQIRSVHQHRTKKGDMMAFVKISDESAELDMAVMPRLYQECMTFLVRGAFILFRAKISSDMSILADSIQEVRL